MCVRQDSSYLLFTDGTAAVLMTVGRTSVAFQYGDGTVTIGAGDPCEIHIDARAEKNAKGSFTCRDGLVMAASPVLVEVSATFDAHD